MVEKQGQKIWAGVPPPPLFGKCPKENIFFFVRASLTWNKYASVENYLKNLNEMASIKDSRCSLNLFRYLKNFSKKFKKVDVEPIYSLQVYQCCKK